MTYDILIFIVFFILNIFVGLKYRIKKQSFIEYAIGNKKFSTAILTATIVATWASGSLFFSDLEQTYTKGLYYIIPILVGSTLGLLISGFVVAPRMGGGFLNQVSLPAAMGNFYGKNVQVIAALSSLLFSIGFIAIQFKIIERILAELFHYQDTGVTIVAASIIIAYSAFGGVRSVTFTDVLQFFTFGTLVPALALTIWSHIPHGTQVLHTLATHPNFDTTQLFTWSPQLKGMLILMFYVMTPGLPPALFQRMAMARNIDQIKKSIAYAAGLLVVIEVFIIWTGILLLADNPDLEMKQIVAYLIEKHTYTGLRGFLGVGILALVMSSADSNLNACSVIVAHDMLVPLKIIKTATVKAAAMATFVIGLLALLLTFFIQNLLNILLFSANFYLPVLTIPVLLTIFGFRTSRRVILIGMVGGALVTAVLMLLSYDFGSFTLGMLASLASLLGSHYLLGEKGGWVAQKKAQADADQESLEDINWTFSSFARWDWKKFKFISDPMGYLISGLPNREHLFPLFAFYLVTAAYLSLYTLPTDIAMQYMGVYRTIQYSTLLLCTTLVAVPLWPDYLRNKRVWAFIWPALIFYALFFVEGLVMTMGNFQPEQVFIFMLNVVMAVLLTHWPIAITLAFSGLLIANMFFKWTFGMAGIPHPTIPIAFQLGYGLLIFSSLLIALFRFKQANKILVAENTYLQGAYQETVEQMVKSRRYEERFVRALDVEGLEEIVKIVAMGRELLQSAQRVNTTHFTAELHKIFNDWQDNVRMVSQYLQVLAHRSSTYLRLDVTVAPIAQVMERSKELLVVQGFKNLPQVVLVYHNKKSISIEADIPKVKQMLLNALLYAFQNHPDHIMHPPTIVLEVTDTCLGYPINGVEAQLKQIPALCFKVTTARSSPLPGPIYLGSVDQINNWLPDISDDLFLSTNQRIVEAHYGYMTLTKKTPSTTQLYILPRHVRDVRPKEMDASEIDIETYQFFSNDNFPGAAAQEAALLKAVESQTEADIALVEKALKLIKKYHGPVKRKSGEPFYLHPVTVAQIVLGFTKDPDVIISALLHDLVEDTSFSLPQVGLMFNTRIQCIVDGATHMHSSFVTLRKIKLTSYENIQKLLESQDKGVLYVKLADRLHNMRTIQFHSSLAKQKLIADETLQFFVPIAQYLGLTEVMEELKNLSIEVLQKQEKVEEI